MHFSPLYILSGLAINVLEFPSAKTLGDNNMDRVTESKYVNILLKWYIIRRKRGQTSDLLWDLLMYYRLLFNDLVAKVIKMRNSYALDVGLIFYEKYCYDGKKFRSSFKVYMLKMKWQCWYCSGIYAILRSFGSSKFAKAVQRTIKLECQEALTAK